ncbi:hypothetical protein Glove_621g17 [Diversispora epigaea]|uniref:BACK domain-containing protein n=1 Tax=Diversispora epigaea TaxID=1348612 RepID=A0A397G5Y3_9GLOM|nr:hypothetical protein Glove_621g17 [Diversispora epigaea]
MLSSKEKEMTFYCTFSYRSSYFDKEFENTTTNANNIKTIVKPSISAQIFEIILKNDLKVEKIKIWDYVIKWGIAQNPTLPTNLEEWSNENFKDLKITLQQCLPLIRYFHIPGEDIWEKIKLYKKILEKLHLDDIIQHSISQLILLFYLRESFPILNCFKIE